MPRADRPHIVIAGAGVAAFEALLALRAMVGGTAATTLVASAVQTVDRPLTVAEPFDRGTAPTRDIAAIAADAGAELLLDRLVLVDATRRTAVLASGRELPYDALLIATGCGAAYPIPGVVPFGRPGDVSTMAAVRDELRSGAIRSVAFALPMPTAWPVPLYELALMTGADLRTAGVEGARVIVATPEPAPLAIFGPAAAEALAPILADRGVEVRTGVRPVAAEPGRLVLADGAEVPADRVVATPVASGRPVAGVPEDAGGFVPVDAHGRVPGLPGVYAAGDVTAFPLKQGGLAAQQADAAAEAIAAELGAAVEPQPFRPVVRAMVLVGGVPLYLRAEIGAPAGPAARDSVASWRPLWSPPAKVAGRYLAPYLAGARPRFPVQATLVDRASPEHPTSPAPALEAVRLSLVMADSAARWGDYGAALRALDAAEAAGGPLPEEYARKRERWLSGR